ncbi:decapping and exoribonuclease protein-like [Dermacentor andersoni]|uniref:decapping and exoribonuclease protein-like n=1 Tax=Dermacentor andersoni TaxID=34620 RepID=UPI002417CF00|nr:decapping and exoribonuclease protein-like [Dermacentor andersoni]
MMGDDFGASTSSAAADELHRGICLAAVGEPAAVLTMYDALSVWTDGCSGYDVLCEIGSFSVDGVSGAYVDGASQKRYLRLPISRCPGWDLNTANEDAVLRNRLSSLPSPGLLHWVIFNKDKVAARSSREDIPSSVQGMHSPRTDFVCGRQVLAKVLCTPFAEKIGWRLVACRHRGIVYIHPIRPNTEVKQPLNDSPNWKPDRMRDYANRFCRLMTTSDPGASAEEGEVCREDDAYNVVLRCQLGLHSIVLGAEVKAVDPSVQCEPGSTAGYVELKTNRKHYNKTQRNKFYKQKLIRWWAHCRLAGVPRTLCGIRDDNGIVLYIREIDVMKMPEMARGHWSDDVCMNFCNRLLSFIKENVEGDDGRTAYLFEYTPSSREVACKRLPDPENIYGIPDWFIEAFEDC